MELTKLNRWFNHKRNRIGKALLSLMLLGATTATIEAGTLSLDLQGCRATDDNNYRLEVVPDVYGSPINMYFCDDAAYTQGNMKYWSELDLVPHHIIFSNTIGSPQSFVFRVGGDYKDTSNPDVVGWDYISELTLDENATRAIAIADSKNPDLVVAECQSIGGLATQNIVITPNDQEIYREVNVTDYPNDLTCVAIYNMRLAIGSSRYSGSSLQSRLISVASSVNVGDQTLPLPDVISTAFSKNMAATQGGSRTWTVKKSTSADEITFYNTCDSSLPLQKDVNITVTWTKGDVTPAGNISITTIIQANNSANRAIDISVVDTLYSGTTQTNQVAELNCSTVTLEAHSGTQTICEHTFIVPDQGYEVYNDVAVATYHETDVVINYPGFEPPTLEATASAYVQGTSQTGDENATITDREWLTGNDLNYSVAEPATGTLDLPYIADTKTNGEVNWTSDLETTSGSVTFTKTVYAPYATQTTGTLNDIATLTTGSGTSTNSLVHTITLTASAEVNLTITKTMDPADIPDGETLDFNFTVVNGIDFNETFTLEVSDAQPSQSITISGLTPAVYGVSELAKPGYAVDGSSVRVVDLTVDEAPNCSATVVFTNVKAGRPGVEAYKVTDPMTLNTLPLNGDWNMTLYKMNAQGSWVAIESNLTDPGTGLAVLLKPNELETGHYKIEEVLKDGWYEVGSTGSGCEFDYNASETNPDANQSTFVCVFANALYGTVTINKAFIEGSTAVDFNFTQDINVSEPLVLGLTETTKVYSDLEAGQFTVIEDDAKLDGPSPSYDLVGLVCTESLGEGEEDDGTTTDLLLRTAYIDLDPGENIVCTFTNQERGRISVLKTEDGNATTEVWTFTLQGPEGIIEHNTTSGLDFSDARLQPGVTYTLCEIYVREEWDAEWFLNDVNITADLELIPHDGHIDRCYDFNVSVGETAAFVIDNISPPDAAMLGDYVWYDDDNDGIQDVGEDPVQGMRVELLDINGTPIVDLYGDNTKFTDENGTYFFYVNPGEYRVRFSGMPSNYVFAPTQSGLDPTVDSDADSNGLTGVITMSGADNLTIDAGIYCSCLEQIDEDRSPAMGTISASLMMLMTLIIGLFFVRREEQLKRNRR